MIVPKSTPPQAFLLEILSYEPNTGVLTWRHRPSASVQWNAKMAGKPAGSVSKSNGRLIINLRGELYLAHRIIWKMVTGYDLDRDIDHRDTNPLNNAWINLRPATKFENLRNSRKHRRKALPKGVSRDGDRYRASIYVDRRCKHLGTFDSPAAAHAAYVAAAIGAFGEFARAA